MQYPIQLTRAKRLIACAALSATLLLPHAPASAESDPEIEALRAQIIALQNRLDHLEQQRQQEPKPAQTAAPASTQASAQITVDRRGLVAESADKNFSFRIRPRAQTDFRWFPDDEDGSTEMTIRRVRPLVHGKAGPMLWRIMPELAGTVRIMDAWGDLYFNDTTFLRIGKFKGVSGLERLQSFSQTLFIESGLQNALTPTRDIGLEMQGSAVDNTLGWTLGIYNGALDDTDLSNNSNLSKGDFDFGARLFWQPFKNEKGHVLDGLGVGISAAVGEEDVTIADSDRDRRIRYRTHGQATFFRYNDGVSASGQRLRVNPHLYYYHGPFGLLTEWVHNSQELERGTNAKTVDSYAWTFQTSYVLTGENASYSGVRPSSPFNPSQGTWGAFELGIRATELNVGDSAFSETADTRLARSNSTQKATAYTLGINWYLTDNLKAALNYSITDFSGLGLSRSSEEVLASRFQIDF